LSSAGTGLVEVLRGDTPSESPQEPDLTSETKAEVAERPETPSDELPLAKRATTERGVRIRFSEDEVNLALKLLVLNGGSYKPTVEQLKAEGIDNIPREKLRHWRDKAFPRRYWQIRQELGRDVSENVAGRALERALQADDAQKLYIEKAVENVGEVNPDHLAKNALALANVMSQNVEKAQLLRDRPTEIRELKAADELVEELVRLGVAEKTDVVDAVVVEEEDVD